MDFQRITPPTDPHAFLPVRAMLHVSRAEAGYGSKNAFANILRGGYRTEKGAHTSVRNGLPMLAVRRTGMELWTPVARVDSFCAFLSHRRVVVGGWKKGGNRIQPMDPARRRRVLNPEWMRVEASKRLNRTRKIAECLRDGKELEWRRM